jgi:hypothetical protein
MPLARVWSSWLPTAVRVGTESGRMATESLADCVLFAASLGKTENAQDCFATESSQTQTMCRRDIKALPVRHIYLTFT